jgi:hypothetical protein
LLQWHAYLNATASQLSHQLNTQCALTGHQTTNRNCLLQAASTFWFSTTLLLPGQLLQLLAVLPCIELISIQLPQPRQCSYNLLPVPACFTACSIPYLPHLLLLLLPPYACRTAARVIMQLQLLQTRHTMQACQAALQIC